MGKKLWHEGAGGEEIYISNSKSSVFRNVGGLVGVLKTKKIMLLLIMISRQLRIL